MITYVNNKVRQELTDKYITDVRGPNSNLYIIYSHDANRSTIDTNKETISNALKQSIKGDNVTPLLAVRIDTDLKYAIQRDEVNPNWVDVERVELPGTAVFYVSTDKQSESAITIDNEAGAYWKTVLYRKALENPSTFTYNVISLVDTVKQSGDLATQSIITDLTELDLSQATIVMQGRPEDTTLEAGGSTLIEVMTF